MKMIASNWRAFPKNTLIGFVDLTFDDSGLTIKECALHQRDGKEWISFPGKPLLDKDGRAQIIAETKKPRYVNIIECADIEKRTAFQRAALEAVHRLLSSVATMKGAHHDVNPFI
jgi:hypothetical protein